MECTLAKLVRQNKEGSFLCTLKRHFREHGWRCLERYQYIIRFNGCASSSRCFMRGKKKKEEEIVINVAKHAHFMGSYVMMFVNGPSKIVAS